MIFKTDYRLMQVKSIAECLEHSALQSAYIKLPVVIKTFVLSIFGWPFYTGFTVSCPHEETLALSYLLRAQRGFILLVLSYSFLRVIYRGSYMSAHFFY